MHKIFLKTTKETVNRGYFWGLELGIGYKEEDVIL